MIKIPKQLLAVTIGIALTTSSNAAEYIYDDLNRLVRVIYASDKWVNYAYDAAGNILSITTTDIPKFAIEGYVRDSDGNPLAEVLLKAGEYTTTTDVTGYYHLGDLPVGDYVLTAELDTYSFTSQEITSSEVTTQVIDIAANGLTPCLFYAVHDENVRDSQLFTINPAQNFAVNLLGNLHFNKDIEALDIHPSTDQIFATAIYTGINPGHLYKVDAYTGDLSAVGATGFKEIDGLSFKPDGSLWGWAAGDGLISIDTQTGHGTLQIAYSGPVEDISWDNSGEILFGVEMGKLLAYNGQTNELTPLSCTLPGGEVEALEILPDGRLLFAVHEDKSLSIHALDIETCSLVGTDISTQTAGGMKLNDVEGIAWPVKACSP